MTTAADDFHVPDMNLAQFMIERMQKYGDSVALTDANTNKSYTYSAVIDRIQRLAAGLRDLGLRQGDVLCILTHNHIDYPIIWYAVNMVGATFQTAPPGDTDDDLIRRFQKCSTKFLVTTSDQVKRIRTMVHNLKLRSFSFSKPNILNQIIVMAGEAEGCISYDSLFTTDRITTAAHVDSKTADCILLSSSGTSGLPKFVRLTHRNILANLPQLQEVFQLGPGMCAIVALPLYHHYGIHTVTGTCLFNGTKLVVMEKYHFEEFIAHVQHHKVEVLTLVPPMAIRLVKYASKHVYDFSGVRCITNAAAPLGIEVEKQLLKLFNITHLTQLYGLTETGMTTGNKKNAYKPGSSGVVPKGAELKIVDPETGRILRDNETGEILVRGPQITIGYLNEPEITKASFDSDEYFKTGDLGYRDTEGFVYIVDRLKELIKYKGLQVAPAYLEDLLMKHPDLADSAVIGIPDDEAGELPKAFVVKQPKSPVTETDVINYVADHVALHMRLRGGVEFVSQIPKSPSGKILRRLLRQKKTTAKL